MKKAVFLFIAFFVGCATTSQKYDESYYEALAEKDAVKNTIIDDNTYYGITLDETIDHKKYIYFGIDDESRCKKYGKINPNDIFHFVHVYTDVNDKVLKIIFYRRFSDENDAKEFFGDMRRALQTKYPKLKPLWKDILEHLTVTFTDDKEQYKKEFIKEKKWRDGPHYTFSEWHYYHDTKMIHPMLNMIMLDRLKKNDTSFSVVLEYISKKYWKVFREGREQSEKEMREKLKGF